MIQLTRAQLHAFLALVIAVVLVSLAPIVTTGIMGRTIPDALIAVSDKTVTGLVGVLGTLVGVMWQSRPKGSEEPQPVVVEQPANRPVPVVPEGEPA